MTILSGKPLFLKRWFFFFQRIEGASSLIVGLTIFLSLSGFVFGQHTPNVMRISRGADLFNKRWNAGEELPKDMLGPVFNARSCAECHIQGAASGNEHNAQILSVIVRNPDRLDKVRHELFKRNPLLIDDHGINRSVILHRFGTDPNYEDWRLKLLGIRTDREYDIPGKQFRIEKKKLGKFNESGPIRELPSPKGARLIISERNSPSLLGLSLIDQIPDATIRKLADIQSQKADGISGRVARPTPSRVGKFGWRGQMETLRDFVLTACAVELGLQVQDRQQAKDPINKNLTSMHVDLSYQEQEELLAFVVSLDAPQEILPQNNQARNLLKRGQSVFSSTGCIKCHVPNVGGVRGLYTDLLLHDMGPDLEDPAPAVIRNESLRTINGGGYLGGSVTVTSVIEDELFREWRTPPLWGVGNTAPYMHDGRAKDLVEAIQWHGGEAADSRNRFRMQSLENKRAVIAYLRSLGTPHE